MGSFTSFRNDTFVLNVAVTKVPPNSAPGTAAVPVDVTGWTFWFTVKYAVSDPDVSAIFQGSTLTSGVVITDPPNGLVTCTMPTSATTSLPELVPPFVYDVQAKDLVGNITTIDSGTIQVTPDVTRAT